MIGQFESRDDGLDSDWMNEYKLEALVSALQNGINLNSSREEMNAAHIDGRTQNRFIFIQEHVLKFTLSAVQSNFLSPVESTNDLSSFTRIIHKHDQNVRE